MEISLAGVLVCIGLYAIGFGCGAPLIVGLLGSCAFGATAIAAVGGSTIPIFAAFAAGLMLSAARQEHFAVDLADMLERQPLAQLVCLLTVYGVASALILPRLFFREATAIVPTMMGAIDMPVGPVPGNLNQSAYFMLNALVFFAICIRLRRGGEAEVRLGFRAWACIHAIMGGMDVISKLLGLGDILESLRTAGYAMIGEAEAVGFWRIVGAFPEASAYAAVALQALAFAAVDWRATRSRLSLVTALALLALLLFSTSSTGYIGLAMLLLCTGLFSLISILRGRILVDHLVLFGLALLGFVIVVALYLYDARLFDPLVEMLLDATFNKTHSDSAMERNFWNMKGLEAFVNTLGVGIGLGSSRSSSWPISVLSQLGVLGAAGFAIALGALLYGLTRLNGKGSRSLPASASAAALAGCAASSFGGNGADPGLIFFIALAAVSAALGRRAPAMQHAR